MHATVGESSKVAPDKFHRAIRQASSLISQKLIDLVLYHNPAADYRYSVVPEMPVADSTASTRLSEVFRLLLSGQINCRMISKAAAAAAGQVEPLRVTGRSRPSSAVEGIGCMEVARAAALASVPQNRPVHAGEPLLTSVAGFPS